MNINSLINSPIEKYQFQNQTIFIKRDDLLNPHFSGNKARKFHYYLLKEFPSIKKIVSYGSNQSNAMYSLSVLSKIRGWEFEYYVDHLPQYLIENPHGNHKYALANGMRLIVGEPKPIKEQIASSEVLFVEEGGRQESSAFGITQLAKEIHQWQQEQKIEELNIFLPSGTGTTALYLQKAFVQFFDSQSTVYTTPCVGDVAYLKLQFSLLESEEIYHPIIIKPQKRYHFGKLYRESYNIWLKLQDEIGIEFDLLYDPVGWNTMMANSTIFSKPLLYIHQGGLIGNESMLLRYQRRYGENI